MPVFRVETHRVKPVPIIHDCLLGHWWDPGCQLEWCLHWKSLSLNILVQLLVVYGPPGLAVALRGDNHAGEPGGGCVGG